MDNSCKVWDEIPYPLPNFNMQLFKFGNGKLISSTLYFGYNCLSMLGIKLNQISKRGSWGSLLCRKFFKNLSKKQSLSNPHPWKTFFHIHIIYIVHSEPQTGTTDGQGLWSHMALLGHNELTTKVISKWRSLSTQHSEVRLVAQHKTAVTPLLTHWSYCSLALSHRDNQWPPCTESTGTYCYNHDKSMSQIAYGNVE